MKRLLTFFLVLAVSLLVLGSQSACFKYDALVEADETANELWANVEVQYQRRMNLIPQLVAVVKASAAHERETLVDIEKAQNLAQAVQLSPEDLYDPEKVQQFHAAQAQLGTLLMTRMPILQEAYPNLKANDQFATLMVQIEGTENRISVALQKYNKGAQRYNSELRKVDGATINRVTGKPFAPRAYFAADPNAHIAPKVEF